MSSHDIVVWFVWGFFMGLGWSIASYLVAKLTARFG